jgi:hypothetical protein
MYDTYFLSIEFSSLLLVMSWIQCVSTWQYAPNTKKLNHHKIRLRNVENWSIAGWYQKYLPTFYQNAPKFSPQLWHFSPQVQKRYNYRKFKSLNITWCIVCFFLHLLRRLILFLQEIRPPFSMLNAKRFEILLSFTASLHHV